MTTEQASLNDFFSKAEQALRQSPDIDLGSMVNGENQQQSLRQALDSPLKDCPEDAKVRILDEFFRCGPLEKLLHDEDLTEIIINGPSHIFVERQGQLQTYSDHFLSELSYRNFVHRLCQEAHIPLNLNQPCGDGQWRGFRVHIAQAPLVRESFHICLRRHPESAWTLDQLAATGWTSPDQIESLRRLIRQKKNLMIVGPTSSGKTSVLNALLGEINDNERAVIIEDASEIAAPSPVSVKLLTRTDSQGHLKDFLQSDLVRQALRMRPDRLVMGEVRGEEAKDLLLALSTGHRGSMGTLHADSARQALWRLEMLVQMGAPHWSLTAIRKLIQLSLDAIVVVTKDDGLRCLEGIYRIASLEEVGFLLEKLG